MRLFSKITVIFNLSFIIAVVLWYVEFHQKQKEVSGKVIKLPTIEGTFVILGYGAIIINLLFLLICFIYAAFKVKSPVPSWMILFCLVMFCCQIFFHFFYK